MIRYAIFGSLLLSLLLSSCRKDSDDNPVFEINIDNEFSVDLWEELHETGPIVRLDIQTIEKRECDNYLLDYSLLQSDNTINLNINSLSLEEDCNPIDSYISTSIPLGTLEEGDYFIQINLREEIVNKGKLNVFDDHYELEMDTDHGIALLNEELYRVPNQSIWGYIAYSDARDEAVANEMIAELEEMSEAHNYAKGYYGYFTIDNDQQLELHQEIEPKYSTEFLLNYQGTEEQLIELIEDYRQMNGDQLEIKVFTATGAIL